VGILQPQRLIPIPVYWEGREITPESQCLPTPSAFSS